MPEKSRHADKIYSQAISSENYKLGIEQLNDMVPYADDTSIVLQFRSHLHAIVGNKVQAKVI